MKFRTAASGCLVLGLATTTLAGCAWFGPDDAARADGRPKVRLWSTPELKPFSQVTAVDGVGVALAGRENRVFVVGLDPTSGRVLWRRETTPSRAPRGIAMSFATIGPLVALLSPTRDDTWRARMQIVSARSGETVAYSSVERFVRYPAACDDDPKVFCAQLVRDEGVREVAYEVRLGPTGPARVQVLSKAAKQALSVGADGLSVGFSGPQQLVRIVKGEKVWSRRPTVMGPRSDLNHGWNFDLVEAAANGSDVFVGTVGRRPRDEEQHSRALTDTSTAGLRASDGAPLWVDEGSDLGCEGALGPVSVDDEVKSYVRCRSTGEVVWPKGAGGRTVRDLDVTLERFDPATGRAMWQVPLGAATGLALTESENARLLIDDRRQAFRAGSTVTTVDLVSGEAAPTARTTIAWCTSEPEFRDPLVSSEEGPDETVRGGTLARPCDVNGKPVDATPTAWPREAVASIRDGVVIAATPEAFVGYGPEGTGSKSAPQTAVSSPAVSTEVWRSAGVQPFSPVVNIDGAAVAVVRQGVRVFAAGFDPATGKERWRHELGLANVDRSWAPYVLGVGAGAGARAGFFTPAKKPTEAQFTLVDPHTGRVVGRSAARAFSTWPTLCADGTPDVCSLTAARPDDFQNPGYQAWRFSAADARLQLDRPRTARLRAGHGGGQLAAPGLFSARKGYYEDVVGVRDGGEVVWQLAMTRLTKYGRYVDKVLYDPESDVVVLSPVRDADDVSRNESIGVRRVDGRVLWRDRGSETDCGRGSAGGTSPYLEPKGRFLPRPHTSGGAPVVSAFLRCRFHGVWEGEPGGDRRLAGAAATVERFDPATGKTLWAVDLGRGPGLLNGAAQNGSGDGPDAITRIVDDGHLAFGTGADHLVVDVETGKVTVAERTQPAWCWNAVTARHHVKGRSFFGAKATVTSGLLLERCTVGGERTDAPVGRLPESVGTAFAGGLRLVATPEAFTAYR